MKKKIVIGTNFENVSLCLADFIHIVRESADPGAVNSGAHLSQIFNHQAESDRH